jgi:hypothetical protein
MPNARIKGLGRRSLPILKCCNDRWVCAPQYLLAGTSIAPKESVSKRKLRDSSFIKVIHRLPNLLPKYYDGFLNNCFVNHNGLMIFELNNFYYKPFNELSKRIKLL